MIKNDIDFFFIINLGILINLLKNPFGSESITILQELLFFYCKFVKLKRISSPFFT